MKSDFFLTHQKRKKRMQEKSTAGKMLSSIVGTCIFAVANNPLVCDGLFRTWPSMIGADL